MVRHNFEAQDLDSVLFSDEVQYIRQMGGNLASKYWMPILRNPD